MPSLDTLATWVRRHPLLLRGARLMVRLIPDVLWTRRFDVIGPIRFRLRQQRWYLWEPFGKNDAFMLGVFDRLVRPDDVVYDIGANIGIYTRIFAQWFDAGPIIAFEPMRQNIELLEANIALGGLQEQVTVFPMALSNVDGEEELQLDDVRSSTAALNSVTGGEASEGRKHFDLPPMTETVTVGRLDAIVAEHQLPPPQVIKIDTEGAEALVLAGAAETIRKHRPRLTIATHGPDKVDATIAELDAMGIAAYGFVNEAGRRSYRRLVVGDGTVLANNNIVASYDEDDISAALIERTAQACAARQD